ncbi:MAG TPA: type IX secretion system protein PorQ [Bacteroidales bacterium]|nr:type IX secretion system protein PorQ [Bacteroidales bacterium]
MRINKRILIFLNLLIPIISFSQSTYGFLDFSNNARSNALGNILYSVYEPDAMSYYHNPGYINDSDAYTVGFNYDRYAADISQFVLNFNPYFTNFGTLNFIIKYVNYGKFQGYDWTGEETNDFFVNNFVLSAGYGKQLFEKINIGINIKGAYMQADKYAVALASDIALNYYDTAQKISLSLFVRNVGHEIIQNFGDKKNSTMPFNLALAMSKRFLNAPFRFHLYLHDLHDWHLRYTDSTALQLDPFTNQYIEPKKFAKTTDEIMRHFAFGIEIIPMKFLSLMMGYNYQTRQEMQINSHKGLVGFSFGVGLYTNRFSFIYSYNISHLAYGPNNFSLIIPLKSYL